MLDSLFARSADTTLGLDNLLIALAAALLLGLFVGFVYIKINRRRMPSQSFALTLIMLPAVITVIILLVNNNVARAFSLAGAFSIIRFRSAPGDPKDITYVLFTMAIGLSCGMGFVAYAAVIAFALCAVMTVLELTGYGEVKTPGRLLKITMPENLNYHGAFDNVLEKYTASNTLTRIKTTDLGSLYELSYQVVLKDEGGEKEFIDELRCCNGNLDISLVLPS